MTLKRHALRTLCVLAAATSLAAPLGALAQAWPGKQPIRLVAVFPPGGSVDQVSRLLAPHLQQELGQNVIVENKGGASGSIGAAAVAAAPADGYTFAAVFDTHGVNPSLIPNLPFDSRKDLSTVIVIGTSPMVLATHAASEFKTFADVVTAARQTKGASFGSIGSGSLGHLAMALLGKNNGLNFTHIPYKGGGPLMNDAVAGHVPLAIGSVFVVKPHVDSKRMRALAVTTSKRAPQLPEVPIMAEAGMPRFSIGSWAALFGPAKLPKEVQERLNHEVNAAMKRPEVREQLERQAFEFAGSTPEDMAAFLKDQLEVWGRTIRESGIKPE